MCGRFSTSRSRFPNFLLGYARSRVIWGIARKEMVIALFGISRPCPVFTVLSFQIAIRLGVSDDRFGLRVELQMSAGSRDDVGQMRVSRRDMAQFDFRIRRLATADAINEIAGVSVRFTRVFKQNLLAFAIEDLEARFA